MTRAPTGVARRYARALLDVALAKGDPARVREDLAGARAVLRDHPELSAALEHPALSGERRAAVARGVFAERVSELSLRLLTLLAERGRMALLPAIAAAYASAFNLQRGVVTARAVSARELEPGQGQALRAALARVTGREVELETAVDAALLGGLVVSLEGRTYDGSVRTQLESLRRRLVGAAP